MSPFVPFFSRFRPRCKESNVAVAALIAGSSFALGCETPPPAVPAPPPVTTVAKAPPPAPPPADPLGARPVPDRPPPYVPPVPVVRTLKNGMTVWLLERHSLPLVSVTLVVPGGAAVDPSGKEGLSWITANMLDEGAGKRGALDLARHFESLGAQVKTGAVSDYSFAQLTVLKRNLPAVLPAYVDVLAAPTFSQADFSRVKDIWRNDLTARRADPQELAKVASVVLHYGPTHPYGHATEGSPKSAQGITLDDVKSAYKRGFRADTATLVVAGDVSPADLERLIEPALARFPAAPAGEREKPKLVAPAAPEAKKRRVVIVDRPDAPQSVVALLLPSLSGGDLEAPVLSRVNIALGGSFTSRLNQDLREERGITYGASSRLSFARGPGLFVAQAAVQSDKTGDAVGALLADVAAYAKDGPTEDETEKTRLVARADQVEAFESVSSAASRLARLAGIGLAADHDARSAKVRDEAGRAKLAEIAKKWLDPKEGTILVVGPKSSVLPQLEKLGLGPIEVGTVE